MFILVDLKDVVQIHPEKFGEEWCAGNEIGQVTDSINAKYANKVGMIEIKRLHLPLAF